MPLHCQVKPLTDNNIYSQAEISLNIEVYQNA